MRNKLYGIIQECIRDILSEARKFVYGSRVRMKPGVSREAAISFIAHKYKVDPNDIYPDNIPNTYVYYPKRERKKSEYAKRENETHEEYVDRIRKLNTHYSDAAQDLPGEEWRPLLNQGRYFKGQSEQSLGPYEVSNMGRVRRINYFYPEKSFVHRGYPWKDKQGLYLKASGKGGGTQTSAAMHNAIADTFLEKPEGNLKNYYVRHKNGDLEDNRVENLEYCLKSDLIKQQRAAQRAAKAAEDKEIEPTTQVESIIRNIIRESIRNVITESDLVKGTMLKIKDGVPEKTARMFLAKKYGVNPQDFTFDGFKTYTYNPQKRRRSAPKTKKFLGRGENETHDEYVNRVRQLNSKFADTEREIEGEEWRPLTNTGRYFGGNTDYTKSHEVSNMGRIRTIDYQDPMRSRISTGYDAPTRGARQFHLDTSDDSGNSYKTTPPIHTMVADAWLNKPEGNIEDYDVIHKDGDYHNNRADNLEYRLRKGNRGRQTQSESVIRNIVKKTIKDILT